MTSHTAFKILFACLCAVAVFSGLWGFLTGSGAVPALVAAVVLLVAAQLLLFFIMSDKGDENNDSEALEAINTRLGGLEQQIERLTRLREVPLAGQATSQPTIQVAPQQPVIAPSIPVTQSAPDVAVAVPPKPFAGPAYLDDQRLSLYLEPVVDISSKSTFFYRAELAFKSDRMGKTRIAEITEEIIKDGHSADIDMKLFYQLGPVIGRLAEKGRLAGVICPMSHYSFSNQLFLEELTRYLKQFPELARVLVIEISQENLADLSQDGMVGLAFLAQIGATFCLGGAGLESPDLASLASLGFRYLDLDYNDNVKRYGLQSFGTRGAAAQLRSDAQEFDIALIGSGFERKSQCDALNHVIKYGRGNTFSAPRLVRTNIANLTAGNKAA